jgi:hypothetical protein
VNSEDGTDDGYVHTPGTPADDSDADIGADDRDDETVAAEGDTARDEPDAVGFGGRGWLLVGIVVLTFLVIPVVVYLYPAAAGGDSLPFLVGLIVLPMLPAVLLGLTAVWTMTAAAGDAGAVDDDRLDD